MIHRHAATRAFAVVVGAGLTAASAAALEQRQFVAGWSIEAPAGAQVFDVPLPAEVYADAPSIEHVAVLDANGAALSFFRRTLPAPAATEQRVTLEASPLYVNPGSDGPTVGVTTNGRDTSVTVTPGAASAPAVTGFVLDAREVTTAPIALELDWRALPQPFLLDVRVEQSVDLNAWRSVGGGSVATLAIGDAEVRHARVPLRAGAGGYYRVTANRAGDDWYLLRAVLVSSAAEPVAPSLVRVMPLAAAAGPADTDSDALYFDAGATLPASAVDLAFAGGAGWVRADIAASESLEGPWTPVAYGQLFYSLTFEGQAFTNDAVPVGRREARYWRVLPAAPLRGQRLELMLEFPQEYLRVGANGGAPYLLVAGTLAEEAGPDPTFASVWSELLRASDAVPLARLGQRSELGGAAALVAQRAFPWRTAALWTVLIGGVLVVGAMAVRLAREMHRKPS